MNTPRRIRDIAPGFSSSNPFKLSVLGSSLFFTANDGSPSKISTSLERRWASTTMISGSPAASRGLDVGSQLPPP
jgi:hypothetical protein